MGFTPTAGTNGRVIVGQEAVAGVNEWRIAKQVSAVPFNHFEITGDEDGLLWEDFLTSLASATVSLRGHYNAYTFTDFDDRTEGGTPGLKVGASVTLDLLFNRDPFGYHGLSGTVISFEAGTSPDQTGTFSATVKLRGTVPVALEP